MGNENEQSDPFREKVPELGSDINGVIYEPYKPYYRRHQNQSTSVSSTTTTTTTTSLQTKTFEKSKSPTAMQFCSSASICKEYKRRRKRTTSKTNASTTFSS